MSVIGNVVRSVFGGARTTGTTAASGAMNAAQEAHSLKGQMEAFGIEAQEQENALSGMRRNLSLNQMRRANDAQKALGGIG